MKRKITFLLIILLLGAGIISSGSAHASNLNIVAASCKPGSGSLTSTIFVPWYKYLPGDDSSGKCRPEAATKGKETDLTKTITLVAIAVIELLTRISALVAVGFVILGSFQYITSQGEPQNLSNAKTTITNAIIGLILVVLAISVVQFLGRAFG